MASDITNQVMNDLIASIQAKIDANNADIANHQSIIDTLNGRNADLQAQLDALNTDIPAAAAAISAMNAQKTPAVQKVS